VADDADAWLAATAPPVAPAAESAGPTGKFDGLLEPGNIDLAHRPRVKNPDGSISTVRSASFNIDGKEVLLPTVSDGPHARVLSDDEAVKQYMKTGRHLGKFKDPDAATRYAQALHEQQAKFYGVGGPPPSAASDPVDQWLAATAPPPAPAPVNHRPRSESMSDEDLGIGTGAQVTPLGEIGLPARAAFVSPPQDINTPLPKPAQGLPGELRDDPTARGVVSTVLAGGAGKLVAPVLGRVAGPLLTRAGTGALEGGIQGGGQTGSARDALEGAALGGALGAGAGAIEGAPARVRARALKDVVQGEGEGAKPTKSQVRKLAARAGEEGERLGDVLDEDPALEHTLSTAAARNPKKALESVQEIIDRNDAMNAPVYKAITDAGGVKLTDVVGPMKKLKDGYLGAGKGQAAEAVQREIDSLVKNYGGKQAENAVLSGEQLRGMRNEIGDAAFGTTPGASRALKTQVKRDLYGAYRGAIEDATSQLEDVAPGVNLDRFRARNKSTSVLIPMRDVLKERLMNEQTGAKSLVGRLREAAPEMLAGGMLGEGVHLAGGGIKEAAAAALATKVLPAAGRAAAQVGRHIDYGLSRVAAGAPAAAETIPATAARTATVGAAAKDSGAPSKLLNGVRLFGRPATAEERTAAGLPAALHHALDVNDHNLGHAALIHEVIAP